MPSMFNTTWAFLSASSFSLHCFVRTWFWMIVCGFTRNSDRMRCFQSSFSTLSLALAWIRQEVMSKIQSRHCCVPPQRIRRHQLAYGNIPSKPNKATESTTYLIQTLKHATVFSQSSVSYSHGFIL